MMQKAILGVLASLLVLSVILSGVMAAQDTVQPQEKLIHTSTTGEVLTQPDQVEIPVSVPDGKSGCKSRTAEKCGYHDHDNCCPGKSWNSQG